MHVAVIGQARRFADGQRRLGNDVGGVDHQRVAFPVPDRMTVEGGVGNCRMAAAIGIDAADAVAVGFAKHGHASRREQDLHGVVGDQHPGRVRFGKAIGKDQRRTAGFFLGEHVFDLLGGNLVPWRRVGFDLLVLIRDLGIPDAAPVRQFADIGPVLGRRRRVDHRGRLWRRLRAGDRRRQHEGEQSNRSDTDWTRFHAQFSEGKE